MKTKPPTPPPSAKCQQRVQLPADLDHQTLEDAVACGLSQPQFLAQAVRHGRERARAALLGVVTYDDAPPLVAALKLNRGRKAGAR